VRVRIKRIEDGRVRRDEMIEQSGREIDYTLTGNRRGKGVQVADHSGNNFPYMPPFCRRALCTGVGSLVVAFQDGLRWVARGYSNQGVLYFIKYKLFFGVVLMFLTEAFPTFPSLS
jgi:hypothetical protein